MKIVIKALLYNSRGEILVLQRSATHPHFAHHLDFPGGGVEPDESPVAAAAREIAEEVGLVVSPEMLQQAYSQSMPDVRHIVFVASLPKVSQNISLSWEHEDYVWLQPVQLLGRPIPQNVDSYYMTVMDYLKHPVH
jgi:8-oxo-dGTP diphosphatase